MHPPGTAQRGGAETVDEIELRETAIYKMLNTREIIISLNICSINSKISELTLLIRQLGNPLVVGLQEVWNTRHVPQIDGYKPLYAKSRSRSSGIANEEATLL